MANMQFANNAVTTLVSGITSIATSMTVTSAVAFPSLTGAQYFYCTLIDAATGLVIEIVKVTAVTGSVFTIVRGQDGTTASAYLTGDKVELRLVRAELNDFPKLDEDNTFIGNITVATLIPTSSTAPANGIYLPTTNTVGIATASTLRLTIDANGNLGVGNASPTYDIDIIHNFLGQAGVSVTNTTSGGSANLYLTDILGTGRLYQFAGNLNIRNNYASGNILFIANGAQRAEIFASGGVSIGNTTDPGATNLSVTGSITTGGSVSGISTGDIGASRSSTSGVLYLGNDGTTYLFRNGATTSLSGTNLSVTGTITGTQHIANGSTSGSSTTGAFAYGTLGYSDTNHLASFQSSVNSYNQVEIQNTNSGTAASADLVVANNLSTASTYYGNVGMNSSGFTGTGSFNLPNAVYLSSTGGATSSDLVLGTTTSTAPGAIHFVINSGTTDAGSISTAGRWAINNSTTNTTPTALLHIGAGTATASTAPLKLTSGTNLTTAEAGAIEYDGVNFYATAETTSGRNVISEFQQFYLSSNVTAFGPASGDFFGATSSASLAATTAYDIECFCYFLKTTAGTAQWIPTFSTALTVGHSYLEYTPVTGFTTTVITGAMVVAEATQQTTTVLTHAATASLTTAVNHIAKLKIRVLTNTACNFRLKFVGSAGTITPQAGSWYTVRKISGNAGNFVA